MFGRRCNLTLRGILVTKQNTMQSFLAREFRLARLHHFNQHYQFTWNRVAIRNPRRCWGSCTSLKNLNFSYKLLFLPPELADYIIVHELCHLKELNHGPAFWALVAEQVPDYRARRRALRHLERSGQATVRHLSAARHFERNTVALS